MGDDIIKKLAIYDLLDGAIEALWIDKRTFSMIKAKFGDNVRSRTDTAMVNESLRKILRHNICCPIQAQRESGIESVFWKEEKEANENPAILPMVRAVD